MSDEHTFIKHAKVGDSIAGTYFIEEVFTKSTKTGKLYADYCIRDASGSVYCKHWDAFADGNVPLDKGLFADCLINVEEYMGKPNYIIRNINKAIEPKDKTNYVRASNTKEDDVKYLEEFAKLINDDICKKLVNDMVLSKIKKISSCPYGINSVYACLGGYVKYTVNILKSIKNFVYIYGLTDVEKDILFTAALLHKIGVLNGYEINGISPAETKILKLYGLKQLSLRTIYREVDKRIENKEKINADVISRMIHCVASYDEEEINKPKTIEALILSESVKVDLKISNSIFFIDGDYNNDEFTSYDPVAERVYLRRV